MGWNPSVLRALDRTPAPLTREDSYGANSYGAAMAHRGEPRNNEPAYHFPPDFEGPAARECREAEERRRMMNPFASLDAAPQVTPKAASPHTPELALRALQRSMMLK